MKKTFSALGMAAVTVLFAASLRAGDDKPKPPPPQTQPAPQTQPTPATSAPGPLDGKSFTGEIGEKGKKADADTFIFKDGRFRSTACDKYGFKDAAYTTSGTGKTMRFRATTVNTSGARMEWDGVINGGKLEGTALLNQDGKPAVQNQFKAKLTK